MLILVAALVLFGPRKLPQLARSIGKTLAEFKHASEGFKEQWEREVERETADVKAAVADISAPPSWDTATVPDTNNNTIAPETAPVVAPPEALSVSHTKAQPPAAVTVAAAPEPLSKRDWL